MPIGGTVCTPTPDGGCSVTVTDVGGGPASKYCFSATECYWEGSLTGTETGESCDPAVPQGAGTDAGTGPVSADPVKDAPPPPPLDPARPPPGCDSLTDPKCGPVKETPPGCTRTTSSTVTGGVREVINCAQTKCTSEACRTTTTTTTNDWGSKDPWKSGASPDSSTKETREVDQPKNPGKPTSSTGPVVGGSGPGKCIPTPEKPCPPPGGMGDSFCEQNPTSALCDLKDQSGCNDASENVGCMKPGKLEEKPLIEQERNLVISKHGDYGPSTSSCPAPTSFEAGGRTIQVPFDLICDFADMIRPLVIGFAWLSAALTFFGFARKG